MVFEDSALPQAGRGPVDRTAVDVCLRLWMEDHGHKGNRWEGEDLRRRAEDISIETGDPLPILGKQLLFDGKSGEQFDQAVIPIEAGQGKGRHSIVICGPNVRATHKRRWA